MGWARQRRCSDAIQSVSPFGAHVHGIHIFQTLLAFNLPLIHNIALHLHPRTHFTSATLVHLSAANFHLAYLSLRTRIIMF